MGFNLKDAVAKAALNIRPVEPPKRNLLHGTGLTQRLVQQAEKQAVVAETQSLQSPEKALAILEAKHKIEEQARNDAATIIEAKIPDAIIYDQTQQAAIDAVDIHKHFCIIGAAGTGKTTIEKAILDKLTVIFEQIAEQSKKENKVYSVGIIAFTGRAVQMSKRALPRKFHPNCQTGHKFLDYAPEETVVEIDGRAEVRIRFMPRFAKYNKRDETVIIIDESSMFPIRLFNQVVDATRNPRFILVGDINQLPPVMDRSVLPFAMMQWPTFELTTIHRQALDNPIIRNSQNVLKGIVPEHIPHKFMIGGLSDGSDKAAQQVLQYVKALARAGKFDPMLDAIIVPTNVGMMGQIHLNTDLVHFFNPARKDIHGVTLNRRIPIKAARGAKLLAIGDKVMLLANDNSLGLTNGQTGVIVDITRNGSFKDSKGFHDAIAAGGKDLMDIDMSALDDLTNGEEEQSPDDELSEALSPDEQKEENQRQASHVTTVKFTLADGDLEVKFQTTGQYANLTHAYAFTCHKSQGGEYRNVIIAMHSASSIMLSREWLYTAVTRAREKVYIMCNTRAMHQALNRQNIKGTNVVDKAKSFLAQITAGGNDVPMLPKAERLK